MSRDHWGILGLAVFGTVIMLGLVLSPRDRHGQHPHVGLFENARSSTELLAPTTVDEQGFAVEADLAAEIMESELSNREHLEAFLDTGWEEIDAEPHDPRVVSLDPALLGTRESELRQQLRTTRVSEKYLGNAATIAIEAREHRTRTAAINSIGHRRVGEGGEVLLEIFETLPNERERSQVLGHIRSESLTSPESDWLVTQLHGATVSESLKKQISMKLVLTGLVEHRGDEAFLPELLERVPDEWQSTIESQVAKMNRRARSDAAL